jgi:hypothetical protein
MGAPDHLLRELKHTADRWARPPLSVSGAPVVVGS